MVPLCLVNNWRSLSGTIGVHALYCAHVRGVYSNTADIGHLLKRNSGPRFALVALWYILTRRANSTLPKFVAGVGVFRSLTCGGWTYVTSTDDHGWHDIFMISYLVATIPWTFGCIALSPKNPVALKYRKLFSGSFYAIILPLIYFFIQHKVHRVAGGESCRMTYIRCTNLTQHSLYHLRFL